jgi:hypothetical protein
MTAPFPGKTRAEKRFAHETFDPGARQVGAARAFGDGRGFRLAIWSATAPHDRHLFAEEPTGRCTWSDAS